MVGLFAKTLLSAFLIEWMPPLTAHAAPAIAEDGEAREVFLEWHPVPDATAYEIQIISEREGTQVKRKFKHRSPTWKGLLKPGLYGMQTRAYDSRGVPGEWSPPSELEVKLPAVNTLSPGDGSSVKAGNADAEEVTLSWDPVPGAAAYQLNIRSTTSEWKDKRKISGNRVKLTLPVAQTFEWGLTAVGPRGATGDQENELKKFELHGPRLQRPKISRPFSEFVEKLSWQAPEYATSYSYELKYLNPETKKWDDVSSADDFRETELAMDISRPSGRYRFLVAANGERRETSIKSKMEFKMRGNFQSPADLKVAKLRNSITKPSHFYAIASYMVSQVQYAAENHDLNIASVFSATGGTGRFGLGYQSVESKWGGYGTADLSGFNINRQNFTFPAVEGHATRQLELGQVGIITLGAGIFYKQLPVVLGSPIDGYSGLGTVSSLGPHLGFIYWIPLSERFGVQINGRAYYTLTGSAANGARTLPNLSYQFGALGSYRLDKFWVGYAGFADRHDACTYNTNPSDSDSFAAPGSINSVTLDGYYLNLILEYSF